MQLGQSRTLPVEKPEQIDLAQAARYFGARGEADTATMALLQRCAENCHILKCPCPELVEFVERGELTGPALERCLAARLAPALAAGPDALVLGCTHFPFAAGAIRRVVGPDVELLDGSAGTARETKRRLLDAGLLVQQGEGSVTIEVKFSTDFFLSLSEYEEISP